MSSTVSEQFPALQPLLGSTFSEYGSVELPLLNRDTHDSSRNETEREPSNADLLEKRTTEVFKVLQLMGLVTGDRSRRLGNLLMLLIAVITRIPPMYRSICVAKDPIMSSSSGLPTILLFSGRALSHHFGALYGYRHRGRLRKNVYLAIERANFCRTCVIVLTLFGTLTIIVSCSSCLLVCHAICSSRAMASDLRYLFPGLHLLCFGKSSNEFDFQFGLLGHQHQNR